jgi:hypothetical protein
MLPRNLRTTSAEMPPVEVAPARQSIRTHGYLPQGLFYAAARIRVIRSAPPTVLPFIYSYTGIFVNEASFSAGSNAVITGLRVLLTGYVLTGWPPTGVSPYLARTDFAGGNSVLFLSYVVSY